jgi:hypothetical protein
VESSYHESGKGHVHAFRKKDRIIMPPSDSIRSLTGQRNLGGWSVQHAEWGYKVRPDTHHRKTAVLDAPVRNPSTIDLWALEANCPELVARVLTESYGQVEVTTYLHVAATRPQLLAVVWSFPVAVRDSMLEALTRGG